METVLGLAYSDDDEVRHDALAVLVQLASSQPAARTLLSRPATLEGLGRLAGAHFGAKREMPLGLALQLLDLLLLGPDGADGADDAVNAFTRPHQEALRKQLQPLLLKVMLDWDPTLTAHRTPPSHRTPI